MVLLHRSIIHRFENRKLLYAFLHLYTFKSNVSNDDSLPQGEGRNNCINYSSSLRWKTSERFRLARSLDWSNARPRSWAEPRRVHRDGGGRKVGGGWIRMALVTWFQWQWFNRILVDTCIAIRTRRDNVGGWNKPNGPSGANNSICSVYAYLTGR